MNFASQLGPKVAPHVPDLPRFDFFGSLVADHAVKLVSDESGPNGEQSFAPPVDTNPKHKNLNGAGFNIRLTIRGNDCLDVLGCCPHYLWRKRQRRKITSIINGNPI